MIIFATDSSSVSASAAIVTDGKVTAERYIRNGLTHSETLLPLINETFTAAGVTPADVDLFCITAGPGSFTGLRIGMATLKGIAASSDAKCVAVSTLEAAAKTVQMTNKYDTSGMICAVMDARCKQVYNALFEMQDGTLCRITPDRALSVDELKNSLKQDGRRVLLCGDGAKLCADAFGGDIDIICPENDDEYIHAPAVAALGFDNSDKCAVLSKSLTPVYLRLPQATRELKARQNQEKTGAPVDK